MVPAARKAVKTRSFHQLRSLNSTTLRRNRARLARPDHKPGPPGSGISNLPRWLAQRSQNNLEGPVDSQQKDTIGSEAGEIAGEDKVDSQLEVKAEKK